MRLSRHRGKLASVAVVLIILILYLNNHSYFDIEDHQPGLQRHLLDRYAETKPQAKSRTLIWVLTYPKTHATSCKAIKETWGKRVDKVLFMSSTNDSQVPTIGLQVTEGLRHLTTKTFAAFDYLYAKELHNFDWFFKVDDDTYVISDNLRHFLSDKNPNEPVAYGLRMSRNDSGTVHNYLHGGSGYVLSREALRRYGELHKKACVHWDIATEDIMLAWCLQRLDVSLKDTKDKDGSEKFLYATPVRHVLDLYLQRYKSIRVNVENTPKEHGGISKYPVTFHKVSPEEMHNIDTLLYWIGRHGEEHERV